MLSNDEIKNRFLNSGKLVDRHGQFVDGHLSDGRWNPSLSRLAHYRLLDGMKDDELSAQLKEQGLSPLEIKFVLKSAHTFIKDVLEIDLATRQAERISTSGKCYALLHDLIAWVNQAYSEAVVQPIELGGRVYQTDEKALAAIARYLSVDESPGYWVDANNEKLEFTLDDLKALNSGIVSRTNALHEKLTDFKRDARIAAEKSEYTKLKGMREKFVAEA
ncbi:hypothetical protein PHOBOS_161 [Erwinia phage vB_EamM_Phobos]|uniref:hypothetical protein n=1 Tax=Erwinia phage vB_EamM_Phobos TaxID=1883377 RepID=UPI00081D3306|nr:hypothetical protein BIZ79_gp161 [Erwinia phage vB_EamM_Phobos]ANZ50351.1 hypothetical protein PHOBOS_161 [Erwinia phage vB_EamM_Phobos]